MNALASFSSRLSRWAGTATLVVWVMGSAAPALAAGATEEAEALLQSGVARRAEGKDEEALVLFQRANATAQTPKSLAQLGLCEQALGMWVLAEQHLRAALGESGNAWIEKNRSSLEGSLARIEEELGWVELTALPAGATVLLDGEPSPDGSSKLRAPTGRRLIEVRVEGFEPFSRRVTVQAGQVTRERVALSKEPERGRRSPDTVGKTSYVEVPTAAPLRTAGWITMGAGLGLGLFGGTGLIVRQGMVDDYNTDPQCPGIAAAEQPPACAARSQGANRWGTIGVVSLVGSAALTTTGVVLVLLAPSRARVKLSRGVELGCDGMGLGVQCMGIF